MITVILIAIGLSTVVFAPFAPGWVSTAQDSFDARTQQKELDAASRKSVGAIVPSQIAPWVATQARTMARARGPLAWNIVSFTNGPCDASNLSQLPASKYSDAISQACSSFDDIQQRYSDSCLSVSACKVPEAARTEMTQALDVMWEAFSDAGFVLPYSETEQQAFR